MDIGTQIVAALVFLGTIILIITGYSLSAIAPAILFVGLQLEFLSKLK